MIKLALFTIFVAFGVLGAVVVVNTQQAPQKAVSPTPAVIITPVVTPQLSPDEELVMKETIATQEATIKTSKGDITLTLYPDVAPKTVANFIKKAESGFYDDLTFHRVEDWVVQGGDPKGNGTGGGDMATELNNKPFIVGSLGVARGQDIKISNDAQFFITKKEASWLNGQYTNFGIVKKGIDVVDTIEISDKILGITVK